MQRSARFTFIVDHTNRTAAAALLASLENVLEDPAASLRTTSPELCCNLDFDRSGDLAEYVCMSAATENFARVTALLGVIRRRIGEGFLSVCGGPHATGNPEDILAAGFDFACVGEGESVVQDLARRLAAGDNVPYSFEDKSADPGDGRAENLGGAREVGGASESPGNTRILRGAPLDLETLPPLPVKLLFPAHIEIGRGCRWNCAYCQTPRIFGHGERFRSPAVVEDTVARYASSGMKDFRLLLPNALGYMSEAPGVPNCEMLEELLARVTLAAGCERVFLGSFPSEVRPDYVTPRAVGVLKKFVANRQMVIGAQSGSQRVLDIVGRGHKVEDVEEACRTAKGHGFLPTVDLMLGFPMEESEDRRATFDLIERLRRARAIVNMHFFMPLPGTPLAGTVPKFLGEEDRAHLEALAKKGVVRGRWKRQEEIAREWSGERCERGPRP